MSKKFIVACGGTGGHTFPGLAVAKELVKRGNEVAVWTAGRSIETSVMKSWDGAVFSTRARKISALNAPAILYSILRCRREMKRFKPDALLAMGSYASLPPVLAAHSLGTRAIAVSYLIISQSPKSITVKLLLSLFILFSLLVLDT